MLDIPKGASGRGRQCSGSVPILQMRRLRSGASTELDFSHVDILPKWNWTDVCVKFQLRLEIQHHKNEIPGM